MRGQVFQTRSEDDNESFAREVARNGLSTWPWIIGHPGSQFDHGGPIACAFTSLQFAQMVFSYTESALRTGDANDVGGLLLVELTRSLFFEEVLDICELPEIRAATRMHDAQEAFALLPADFLLITPLLAGSATIFSPAIIGESIFALEETRLRCALIVTYANHVFSCVYIPLRVPLFLVFDSARRFRHGASIVVHTSRTAATAHITAMCNPGAAPLINFDFFVSNQTAALEWHDATTAAVMLDLRFAEWRGMRETQHDLARTAATDNPTTRERAATNGDAMRATAEQIARDRTYAEHLLAHDALADLVQRSEPPAQDATNRADDDPFLRPTYPEPQQDPPPTYQSPLPRPGPFPRLGPLPPQRQESLPHRQTHPPSHQDQLPYPDPHPHFNRNAASHADNDPFLRPVHSVPRPDLPRAWYLNQPPPPRDPVPRPGSFPRPRSRQQSRPRSRQGHLRSILRLAPRPNALPTSFSPLPRARPASRPQRARTPIMPPPPQIFKAYPTPREDSPPPLTSALQRSILREARQREQLKIRNDLEAEGRYDRYREETQLARPEVNSTQFVRGTVR
ncbi:hypothetical protein C8F04DRAFT_425543 [Mycena alexandri]|uniref:Uncharacterized protein n=1 Tax=Mycena alexandri TaxID=1745969 RepID=A0AAD6RZH1_9AGAR|nr:hypothetical protein C8F04DRAFT_425543 [Mycena alexandri]